MLPSPNQVLLIRTHDKPGLIHTVTGALLAEKANILANHEFVDPIEGMFFMRTEFSGPNQKQSLLATLGKLLPGSHMELRTLERPKIVIFATKEGHCLGDILLRQRFGELDVSIEAVVANHPDLGSLVQDFHIPFFHIPTQENQREEQESQVLKTLSHLPFDYLVLAKYMRILSPKFVETFPLRIINIHHSFLPAFIGANPYAQAYERGVKLIGATAHFVTESLDEGPILAQDVIAVDHTFTKEKLMLNGKDIEKVVLARALRIVFEHRVIVWKNKTIIFG
ncbi:formyltetrahydrofolate deformylase [Leptospira ryugenii]|uniref:Formyltetrahydrofolate deformylase n=1 Tax=Leptospira ryugenii TaxID=1917863 RepID=A0A2P2DVW7_9LEPT|nr:formyltetrahydrofolate deformylase [Leptospira ryugenii]GBF48781.1 formyltetrahydrofolate deformylase [Leptospira ryugenii]